MKYIIETTNQECGNDFMAYVMSSDLMGFACGINKALRFDTMEAAVEVKSRLDKHFDN